MKIYQALAECVDARQNCIKSGNDGWKVKWEEKIQAVMETRMPSGSGWDCGTKIDLDSSTGEKIVLYGSYHHMNENGMYDGWSEHTITVHPSLQFGFRLTVSGRDRKEIKDYLHETFDFVLREEVEE